MNKGTGSHSTGQQRDDTGLLPPLTLYLHVPFCRRKCPYCDFHSRGTAVVPEARYLAAVRQELQWRRRQWAADVRPLSAIYVGGGTPSLLTSATIAGLLEAIVALWPVTTDCEITLEANPESASLAKMRDWRQMGIRRLSLGVQALDGVRLQFLERPHDLEAARCAIRHALQVDFATVNLDLIYATPGQTPAAWERELAEAMAWQPHHFSCYQLTVEPGTPFAGRSHAAGWQLPDEETAVVLFRQTREQLARGGWQAYETSSFARPGCLCRHNTNYWSFGDYLGIGCAAHGKWTDGAGRIWRSRNPEGVTAYMTALEHGAATGPAPAWLSWQPVTPVEAGREVLLMGLRHAAGVDRRLYQRLTGMDLVQQHAVRFGQWQEAGWLRVAPQRVCLTDQGMLLLDTLLLALW
ncbi:MAG: radical SAM family heme chaperone HemW [Magnetococcus sp. DMHC-8]